MIIKKVAYFLKKKIILFDNQTKHLVYFDYQSNFKGEKNNDKEIFY